MELESFVMSTERFLAAQSWLSDEDMPAVTTLRNIAVMLDALGAEGTVSLMHQYGLVYRNLMKRMPSSGGEESDVTKALKALNEDL